MAIKEKEARSGTERAAILLLTLGEQEAAQVLKHMGAKEVQRIGTAMSKLANKFASDPIVIAKAIAKAVDSRRPRARACLVRGLLSSFHGSPISSTRRGARCRCPRIVCSS